MWWKSDGVGLGDRVSFKQEQRKPKNILYRKTNLNSPEANFYEGAKYQQHMVY